MPVCKITFYFKKSAFNCLDEALCLRQHSANANLNVLFNSLANAVHVIG